MKQAFTLIELLVLVTIIAILSAIIYSAISGAGSNRNGSITDKWNEYLTTMYSGSDYTINNASCVTFDSDGDGYVSCTASIKDKDGKIEILSMECGYFFQEGCRAPKPSINIRQ